MAKKLENLRVAILVANGYEEVELTKPLAALKKEGAIVDIVSIEKDEIRAWDEDDWGETRDVDVFIEDANVKEYDALLLPGGVMNPDFLRKNKQAVEFATHFFDAGKPIAAICHGPWLLIETGKIKGKKMTSYESIKTDLKNAGADWVDKEVVVDNGLVTSRKPDDIPAFIDKMIEEFSEGHHEGMSGDDEKTNFGRGGNSNY